jgi:hypothetical protein
MSWRGLAGICPVPDAPPSGEDSGFAVPDHLDLLRPLPGPEPEGAGVGAEMRVAERSGL